MSDLRDTADRKADMATPTTRPSSAPSDTPSADPTSPAGTTPARPDRRTVLRTAGLATAGVASLAACGSGGEAADAAASAGDAASSAITEAIDKASIPVGGGRIFSDAKVVVTQPSEGDFKAFSAVCTHQGCVVSKVEDNTIICGCHNSQFDASTGAVKDGPAPDPLPEKQVTVGADGITVT